jgi:hypothetical protein
MLKKLLLIGLGLLLIAGGIFVAFKFFGGGFPTGELTKLVGPSCPDSPLFTVSPIRAEDLVQITPLGNQDPPDHTIPTDHIYMNIKSGKENDSNLIKPVVSPGEITVDSITRSTAKKSSVIFTDDYSINFSSCRQVTGWFGHITSLVPKLAESVESGARCYTNYPRPEDEYTYCQKQVNIKLAAGEPIGETGKGNTRGLDWQLNDKRRAKLAYANPSRYRTDSFYFVCPLDYFSEDLKTTLYDKLGSENVKRTIEPRCGEVAQDEPGTLQGNWFAGQDIPADDPESWGKTFSLTHDNIDPTLGEVVIGGLISEAGKVTFQPTTTGTINREFSGVSPGETIYCYQSDTADFSYKINGKVLIQLLDATTLKAENKSGGCISSESLTNPTTYYR